MPFLADADADADADALCVCKSARRASAKIHLCVLSSKTQTQGLTRGDQRDSFFTKLSPVCELSLDGEVKQGPFSTSVKPNTTQPSWDDSVEFEARHPPPLPPPSRPPKVAVCMYICGFRPRCRHLPCCCMVVVSHDQKGATGWCLLGPVFNALVAREQGGCCRIV